MAGRKPKIGKALLAGLIGGLVASWTMNQSQAALSKVSQMATGQREEPHPSSQDQEPSDDATMKTADRLSRAILHRPLNRQEKKTAGPVVHYAFGGAVGMLYGVAAELYPKATLGFGTTFGAVLFAVADELAVPAFGLSGDSQDVPVSSHLSGLLAHLTYGAAAEGVRRAAMAVL
jgi:Protein of unknown function (DUF1440)